MNNNENIVKVVDAITNMANTMLGLNAAMALTSTAIKAFHDAKMQN